MKKVLFFALSVPLILFSCGQSDRSAVQGATPTASVETFTDAPQKTVSQTLAEPGWKEVSKGAWFRTDGSIDEWIYLGDEGTAFEASQIKADLKTFSTQSLNPGQERRRTYLANRLQNLEKSLSEKGESTPSVTPQSTVTECTASGTLARTTGQAGVKASGSGNCSNSGYVISGNADTYTAQSPGSLDQKSGFNYVFFNSVAYGTSGCYSHVLVEFSNPNNSNDRRVAVNKSSYSCSPS